MRVSIFFPRTNITFSILFLAGSSHSALRAISHLIALVYLSIIPSSRSGSLARRQRFRPDESPHHPYLTLPAPSPPTSFEQFAGYNVHILQRCARCQYLRGSTTQQKKNNGASMRTSISLEQVAYAILVLGNPKGQRVPITISKFFIERLWYESLRVAHWYLFVSLFLPHFCFPLFPLV
jgi:hypothetical protein